MKVPGVFATSFEPDRDPVGTAVLVPGRGYPPMAPLLFFTGLALLQHGWRVEHHWWDPPAHESDEKTVAWVRAEVEGALPTSGPALIAGKSLATLAAPLAAERELPSIWLTPLLDMPDVVAAITANPAPQLLVGGTADDLWDSAVARDLARPTCRVVEIPGLDHGMLLPGDVVRGTEAHVEVVRAVDAWLDRI
ncbi:MAG TPA: alpha/beta hydrolase [Nocardioides sp.]|uniref:alpha/beta fold hydrolase n=1 Tax=Nocardioides sp. TaxID=35761 RepID=UPI002F40FE07